MYKNSFYVNCHHGKFYYEVHDSCLGILTITVDETPITLCASLANLQACAVAIAYSNKGLNVALNLGAYYYDICKQKYNADSVYNAYRLITGKDREVIETLLPQLSYSKRYVQSIWQYVLQYKKFFYPTTKTIH